MTVSLRKGGSISLAKEAPSMVHARIGLGWKEQSGGGDDFDLDASLFLLNASGRCKTDRDFVFYGNPTSSDGSVTHAGDDRTGGDAKGVDNEEIRVDLQKVAQHVESIIGVVTIHKARERRQNFGLVSNAFIRIVDEDTDREVARYDLTEDFSTEDAVIVARLERKDGSWNFVAIGDGSSDGLMGLCKNYGLDVKD